MILAGDPSKPLAKELEEELSRLGLGVDSPPDRAQWKDFLSRIDGLYRRRQQLELLPLSHDLRTPMTVVLGATELLLESDLDGAQRLAAENVHRSGRELLDVIDRVLAAHEISRSGPPTSGELATSPHVAALLSGRRILLAEDNAFNRALIERVLAPMGCRLDFAVNGVEAVQRFRPGHYDLVLMDCQMPELDGLGAARALRAAEAGGPRTPIVAVTAGNVSGARRACLDAGMDDFLAKPFSLTQLRKVVLDWLLPVAESAPPRLEPERAAAALEALEAVDFSRLRELADEAGSPEIVEELSRIFLDDVQKRLGALVRAARERDRKQYLNLIHAVKGAAGNFGAVRMARLAERHERAAKDSDLSTAEQHAAELTREFAEIERLIERQVFGARVAG